jgi:hypothetical protein
VGAAIVAHRYHAHAIDFSCKRLLHRLISPYDKLLMLLRHACLLSNLSSRCLSFLRALAEETPARLETERAMRRGRKSVHGPATS